MVKFLRTGAVAAAFLVTPIAAPAIDLSMTSIYQGRPSMVAATDWALAERWMIHRRIEMAAVAPEPGPSTAKNRTAWSTGVGYTMLTRWSLNGEYHYVNFLDSGVADAPAGSTTITKTTAPPNRRTLKVGGNYDF